MAPCVVVPRLTWYVPSPRGSGLIQGILTCTPRAQGIRQSGPVTHSSRGHVPHASINHPTLPRLTVTFEVVLCTTDISAGCCCLIPRFSDDELRTWDNKCVLLEGEQLISADTTFLSLDFTHSRLLDTSSFGSWCDPDDGRDRLQLVTTRTVRVIPINDTRPRTFICSIPTEVLLKIFEATNSWKWQHDLLSFSQVCRQWSCSMKVLFVRLESSEWKKHCPCILSQSLDFRELASAFRKTPALGLGVQHLRLNQHYNGWDCYDHAVQKASRGFTPAAIAILRATKNLQHLRLSHGYSSKANALFSALPELHALHTLSITRVECQLLPVPSSLKYWKYSMSVLQLARCMARWPALRSLTVEALKPENICIGWRFISRPPACALTQLCIRYTRISDKDLFYLTASSTHTLAQVTLHEINSLTHDGFFTFLDAISQNVVSLTIQDVVLSSRPRERPTEHALDAMVAKMRCLQVLSIRGDIASERMLRRRSEVFVRSSCGSGEVPVIRLSSEFVPAIRKCWDESEWPGWQVVES